MKLDLGRNQTHVFAGNVVRNFEPTASFKFPGLEP
jgi:hypothetical protein